MSKSIVSITLLFCLFILLGCKTTAPTAKTLTDYKGRKIEYGSRGGITSGGTTISILENGQVFSTTSMPVSESYHGLINSKEAKALIDEGEALLKKHTGMAGTGNMTYSLAYFDGTSSNSITWASEEFPPEDLRDFTKKFSQYIQQAK